MRQPSRQEREALLELFLALGGPLVWTGPIPYDALRARHEDATGAIEPDAPAPVEGAGAPAQPEVALPMQRADEAPAAPGAVPPVTGTCAA